MKKEKGKTFYIGIDLGTTNSLISYISNEDEKPKNVEFSPGVFLLPSIVSFTSEEILIGDKAKEIQKTNPENTIYSIKRLIGKFYNDETVQNDINNLTYRVVENEATKNAEVKITYRGKTMNFTPEEISAFILSELKRQAEKELHQDIKQVVISVPAYFDANQRSATVNAAKIAGFSKIDLVNEPTAAAFSYFMSKESVPDKQTILVFDFGGGTLDITILEKDNEIYTVKSCSGDSNFGGDDFTNVLCDYIKGQICKKTGLQIADLTKQQEIQIREESERVKILLSEAKSTKFNLYDFYEGNSFQQEISCNYFEGLCTQKNFFNKILNPVEGALNKAKLTPNDIDTIIMVGGSTRIPKVREVISKYFKDKPLCSYDHPELTVSHGAAYYASKLKLDEMKDSGSISFEQHLLPKGVENVEIHDTLPISIGIETKDNMMTKVFERGSRIPSSQIFTFATTKDNQKMAKIKFFEGESPNTNKNILIFSIHIYQLPSLPAGHCHLKVYLNLNIDSILHYKIKVLDNNSNKINSFEGSIKTNQLTDEEIHNKQKLIQEKLEEDEIINQINTRKNTYSGYYYSILTHLKKPDFTKNLSTQQSTSLKKLSENGLAQIQKPFPQDSIENLHKRYFEIREEFEQSKKSIEKVLFNEAILDAGRKADQKDLLLLIQEGQDDQPAEILEKTYSPKQTDINKNLTNHEGQSSLHIASHNNNFKYIKRIMEGKYGSHIDLNFQDLNGFTPLHFACKNSCFEIVEFLIKKGASININNDKGMTPLHIVCEGKKDLNNNIKILSFLITMKADPFVKDCENKFAIHYAIDNDIPEYLQLQFIMQ